MLSKDSIPLFESAEIITEYGLTKSLDIYLDILFEYNKKINLVSRETSRSALIRVAADCLVPFKFSVPPSGTYWDIGSGGGFPGIILLQAFGSLKGILYERTQKKARFLEQAAGQLNLNAAVRSDDWPSSRPDEAGHFDLGTMKLVKIDQKIINHIGPVLKSGGRFIYYAAVPSTISFDSDTLKLSCHDYYLDDLNQLRTLSIFYRS